MGFVEDAVHAYADVDGIEKQIKKERFLKQRNSVEEFLKKTFPDLEFHYANTTKDVEVEEHKDYLGRVTKNQKTVLRMRYKVDSAEFGIEPGRTLEDLPRITVTYMDCPVCFGETIVPLHTTGYLSREPEERKKRLLENFGKALHQSKPCLACQNNVCETCGSLLED